MEIRKFELELGTRCNSHCIYCEQGNNPLNSQYGFVPIDDIRAILVKAFNQGFSGLYLQGGEPSIHPDIIEIIRLAKATGFSMVYMITNGRMFFYKKFASEILKAGIDGLTFSIHGPTAEIHDHITQAKGSFHQALSGLDNLRQLGFGGKIGNSTVIIRQNFQHLSQTVNFLKGYGIIEFHFIHLIPYDRVIRNNPDVLVRLSDVVPYAKDLVLCNMGLSITLENIPHCLIRDLEIYFSPQNDLSTKKFNSVDIIDKNEVHGVDWVKPQRCSSCLKFGLCRGLHKNYMGIFGDSELVPIRT